MTLDEDRALTRPDYWDDRYAKGEGHEWFRTFEDLEAFFRTNLLENKQVAPRADPLLLHLGSGDSVRARRPVLHTQSYSSADNLGSARLSQPNLPHGATLASCASTSPPWWST